MEQCVLQILVGCQAVNKSPALDATQRFHHCIHISPSLLLILSCQAVNKSPALDATQRFHHCIHISPSLLLILSQMNPVHVLHPTSLRTILIFSQLCLGHPSSCLHSRFFQIHAICPTHIILDLIIYGEKYELWSSLLPSFLQLPVPACFLASNTFNTPSQTHSSCVPPLTIQLEGAFKIHIKNRQCSGCWMSFTRMPTSVVRVGTIFRVCYAATSKN